MSLCVNLVIQLRAKSRGERSSVGRAPDCDSGRRGFESHRSPHFCIAMRRARVAELVDALDLGSSGATRESSSLSFRTITHWRCAVV